MALERELSAEASELFAGERYQDALTVLEKLRDAGARMLRYRGCQAQCHLAISDFDAALRDVDLGLEEVQQETDTGVQKQQYKQLSVLKLEILKSKGAHEDYRKALEDVQGNPYSHKLREWADSELGGDLLDAQEQLAGNEEYQEFSKRFQRQAQEGDLWHVVATAWVRRWLAHLQGQEAPGPISNAGIVEPPADTALIDPEPSKAYTNIRLMAGLVEGDAFQIVPKPAYHLLAAKYSHDNTEIRRYSIATNADGSLSTVELWLKKMQVWEEGVVKMLYISRKETVADFKEKVGRCLGSGKVTRAWKKKPTIQVAALAEVAAKLKTAKDPFPFREAHLLEETKELEFCDIADEDVLFLEPLAGSQWLLQPDQAECCKVCTRPDAQTTCSGCRTVRYCSVTCQRQHYPLHKEECRRKQRKGRSGLVGLQNLGNTCFMNSAIQCLSHTEALTNFLLEEKYKADLNKKNPIGTGGKLVLAYVTLLQNLWLDAAPVQSPWELKRVISAFAPQFSGYQQHDSHELLSYLLDGIHEDLNRVRNKPYTTPSEDPSLSESQAAQEFWENHRKRNQSVIVDLMHGQYKSTLVCPQCSKVSVTFDPFLTYTLQIPNTEMKKCTFLFVSMQGDVKEVQCALMMTTTIEQVKAILSSELSVPIESLLPVAIEHKRFKGLASDEMELSELKQFELAFYEMADNTLQPLCLNITERSAVGVLRPATWPRLIFVKKEENAVGIRTAALEIAGKIAKEKEATVRIVSRSRVKTSYFMFQSKAPCPFCETKDCLNCELPSDPSLTLTSLQQKSDTRIEFELRFECPLPREHCEVVEHKSVKAAGGKSRLTLADCLQYSSRQEVLSADNAWFCSSCKRQVQAAKTLQMYKSPEVLIFHLKRFRPRFFEKLGTVVDFPLQGLDLQEFVIGPDRERQVYDLYAVSNHFGSMLGGHYTAYVRSGERWFDMDDSSVSELRQPSEIVSAAAYLLFYKRRP